MGHAVAFRFLVLAWAVASAPSYAFTCELLPAGDAEEVLGAAPELLTAPDGGACQYARGKLRLDVVQPATMDDAAIIARAYEAMMESDQGVAVSGIGDRAFVARSNSGWRVMFVKGKTLAGLAVYGDGSDGPETKERLLTAARREAARL